MAEVRQQLFLVDLLGILQLREDVLYLGCGGREILPRVREVGVRL